MCGIIVAKNRWGGYMVNYDGIIVGAGHNGLTLAAYLSRAGQKILVLEANDEIGGGTSTAEPALPGHRFNLHSNFFMGLRHAPLIRDLELYRYGFAYYKARQLCWQY